GLLLGCVGPPLPLPSAPVYAPPQSVAENGSLWHADSAANYPFLDVRAHFPGDLLTIVVSEPSKGEKDAPNDTKAQPTISAAVEAFFGIPAAAVKLLPKGFNPQNIVNAKTERDSKGEATTTREGTLTASITVTVTAVEPSGNLVVQGDKIVTVNREDQHL